ncbi:MAG: DUF962 domain-containing protein [Cellvibrionaceae bacterium]|nr:DUF962 domain-containing protein [Cellvibrionaceae bacterium]
MALFSDKSWDEWISEYGESHTHPANRICHSIGIPMIAVSLPVLLASLLYAPLWQLGVLLFAVGWILQFIGHYYEKKPPEFFKDWRFLFVGLRWWLKKTFGKH